MLTNSDDIRSGPKDGPPGLVRIDDSYLSSDSTFPQDTTFLFRRGRLQETAPPVGRLHSERIHAYEGIKGMANRLGLE